MITKIKTLMESTYLQAGIALILVGMAMLCIDPSSREFLRHFAVHIVILTIIYAIKLLK